MILGIGIDIVDVARIAEAIARHGDRFEAKVFTTAERSIVAGGGSRVERLAARFAAKEAVMKALGTGWAAGVGFRQIEVVTVEGGGPTLRLHGRAAEVGERLGVRRWHLSLTHQPGSAAAFVIAEG